ncbi:hypothetical protein ACH49O_40975 [Streptomyces coeruleorubidus]|uniref:hypothetical protein n=1 Tax=Streptomyces coeruleorubidus TaxID=116188 RepID=UPI0033E096B8
MSEIARGMQLASPTRVSAFLRGVRLPVDAEQLAALVEALGGSNEDVARGLRLFKKAGTQRPASVASWWQRSAYLEQVRDISPAHGLRDRDRELGALAAFCLGDEPYARYVAEPWAGKTALMSTFVLHPPPGFCVLSFFVNARLAVQADSRAFARALLDQVAALSGQPPTAAMVEDSRALNVSKLLKDAMGWARQVGNSLVLVVDGLDEDRGATPGTGLPSIASLLPKSPRTGLKVIVAGRPDPPLPNDVSADHPVRACRMRWLEKSPHAQKLEDLARLELDELLTGNAVQQDVIGLITASGGGLAFDDVQRLTGQPPFTLDNMIGGVLGRTVGSRSDPDTAGLRPVLAFTHETLRQQAAVRLGTLALNHYRDRLHVWADTYRARQWPDDTPAYLLEAYPHLLANESNVGRLTKLVTDPARRERLFERTGGDHAALVELDLCRTVLLAMADRDIKGMTLCSLHREQVVVRNTNIPATLPVVWFRLGHRHRAVSLARSLPDPRRSASAITLVARAMAETGDAHAAEALVALVPETEADHRFGARSSAVVSVAAGIVCAGDVRRATALIQALPDAGLHAECTANLAELVAMQGDLGTAEDILRSVQDAELRLGTLVRLAEAAVETRHEAAPRLARRAFRDALKAGGYVLYDALGLMAELELPLDTALDATEHTLRDENGPPRDWAQLVEIAVRAGDLDRARRIVARTERALQHDSGKTSPWDNHWVSLAEMAAQAGDLDCVQRIAADAEDTYARSRATELLTYAREAAGEITPVTEILDTDRIRVVAAALLGAAARGAQDRVLDLADALVASADSYSSLWDIESVVAAVAETGDFDRAHAVAKALSYEDPSDRVLVLLARAMTARGDWSRAMELVRPWIGIEEYQRILPQLLDLWADACAITTIGDFIGTLAYPAARAEGFADLAALALRRGNQTEAVAFAIASEQAARVLVRSHAHLAGMVSLAQELMRSGDAERGLGLVRSAAGAGGHAERLLEVLAAGAGDMPDSVVREILDAVEEPGLPRRRSIFDSISIGRPAYSKRGKVIRKLTEALIERGAAATAAPIALSEEHPGIRLEALAIVAPALDPAEGGALRISAVAAEALGELMASRSRRQPPGDVSSSNMVDAESQVPCDAFADAVTVLGSTEGPESAVQLVRSFDTSPWRDEARVGLVNGLVAIGALDRAEEAARGIVHRTLQASSLRAVVDELLSRQEIARAYELARTMRDPIVQGYALAGIATQAAQTGDLVRAESIARSMTFEAVETMTRVAVLAREQTPASARNLLEDAEEIVNSRKEPFREHRLSLLGQAWLTLGDVDRALDIARSCNCGSNAFGDRGCVLFDLAPELVRAGGRRMAEQVADILEDEEWMAAHREVLLRSPHANHWAFLHPLADALAEQGLRARTEALMHRFADAGASESARSWLVLSAAQRGDSKHAIRLAEPVAHTARAAVLAKASKNAPDPGVSERMLAYAVATDVWTALPMLMEHDPAARTYLADAYLTLWSSP